nr:PxKF domain-containing protein [Actinomycetota bacterium]
IYNWQSPSKAGSCYQVNIVLTDGKTHSAIFQLR